MRLSAYSGLAVMASSLLVKDVLAAPKPEKRGGGKRGLAIANEDSFAAQLGQAMSGSGSKADNWYYNWIMDPTPGMSAEYVPILTAGTDAATFKQKASGHQHAMFLNEPDQDTGAGGSQTSPSAAAALFQSVMTPLKDSGIQVGAPAVCSGTTGGPFGVLGTNYLDQFSAACQGCEYDFIPFHYYGPLTGDDNLQDYVNNFVSYAEKMPGLKQPPQLWLTEFAPEGTPDPETLQTYLQGAIPFLENHPNIARYSVTKVAGATPGFLGTQGSPNAAGQAYTSM